MEYTELRKKGVYLGRAGEDGKRTVWLDVTAWNEQAGGGSGVLLYTSPKGQVWPLGTKTETDETTGTVKLSAPITLAETAAAGIGHIEAQWMSGGEKVKSQTFNTLVLESAYTGETVPDTAPHWVKELIEELNAAGMLLEELGEVASEAHGAYEEIRGTSALIEQALNTAEQTVAQAEEYAEAAEGHAANADNYKDAAAASATAAAASAEQAMDATPDGYAAFVGSMAGAYSAASGYAVGDYVLKDGQLYKCVVAIDEEGETWTAAHWTAVTAAGQLTQLSEDIGTEVLELDSFFLKTIQYPVLKTGGSIAFDGPEETFHNCGITSLILLPNTLDGKITHNGYGYGNYCAIIFYDENKAVLSFEKYSNSVMRETSIPEGAKYFRLNADSTAEGEVQLRAKFNVSSSEKIQYLLKLMRFTPDLNLYDFDIKNRFVFPHTEISQSTGEETYNESSNYSATDFIPLPENISQNIIGSYTYVASGRARVAFYNADKEFISGVSSTSRRLISVNIPEGAVFVRFGTHTTTVPPENCVGVALTETTITYDELLEMLLGAMV